MTVDDITRSYVNSVLDEIPHRSGDLNSVVSRGKRRRAAQTTAKTTGIIMVVALALSPLALRGPSVVDAAEGGNPIVHLPDGFEVSVESSRPVTSHGASVFLGALADEVQFDTSTLGVEVPLVRKDASELVVPPSSNALERNALRASLLVYVGDLGPAQLALQVTDGEICMFFGNGTDITGAGYCPVNPAPITGSYVDPVLESWLVWSKLPQGTAIVQMVLPNGSTFWQQPAARTAFFYVEGIGDLRGAQVNALDVDGDVIINEDATVYQDQTFPRDVPPST